MKIFNLGIRAKFLTLFIALFTIILFFNIYLSISALHQAKDANLDVGHTILLQKNKEYYLHQISLHKKALEITFKSIEDDVANLKDFTTRLYENSSMINTQKYWNYREHIKHLENNQLTEIETDFSSLWSATWMKVDENVLKKVEISAYLNEYFDLLLERNVNTVANYFIAGEGFIRYYPRVDLLNALPSDLQITQDIYYLPATPKLNPKKEIVWTQLYKDPAGLGWMISAIAPIYVKEKFIGTVGTDVTLEKLLKNYIEDKKDNYSILIDSSFEPIAISQNAMLNIYEKNMQTDANSTSRYNSGFKAFLDSVKDRRVGFEKVSLKDKTVYISFVKLDKLEWLYADIISENELFSTAIVLSKKIDTITNELTLNFFIFTIIFFILFMIIIFLVVGRFLKPLLLLSSATKNILDGDKKQRIKINSKDEIGELGNNFNIMIDTIEDHIDNLDKRVEQKTQELKKINKTREDSINYAALIQQAILPEKRVLDDYFKENFIFWKPRDIVGGDIYFITELSSKEEILIMLIDCAGHGVPGAFVTMLVKAIENQIIADITYGKLEPSPALILEYFNKSIKTMLKQHKRSKSDAGFDGGVLYYNKATKVCKYAGAKTPLYIINSDETGEENRLEIIKSERKNIGYARTKMDQTYEEYNISINNGTMLYLATDGYFDQESEGDTRFRYGSTRFKKLILQNCNKSFKIQSQTVEDSFNKFKNNMNQSDDIAVIGLKF